jgi:Zn-dependent protease
MLRSWRLGKAFGIDIYVHWTFLLLLGFVLLSQWDKSGFDLALFSVASIVALFGCVVLHELGHALAARYFGIQTRDITLYPIGGIARLERMSEKPWEEFWIAIAGPAVNVAIALVLMAILLPSALGQVDFLQPEHAPVEVRFLATLMVMNLFLVAFNMVPAFPMDGGRVLRAVLAGPLGYLGATETAARVGRFFALLFVMLGLGAMLGLHPQIGPVPLDSPMLLLVGGFIYLAGGQELAMVRRREFYRRAQPVDVPPAYADVIDAVAVPGNSGFSGFYWDSRTGAWVVWQNGRPVQTPWSE